MTRRSTTLLASATALVLGTAAVAGCGGGKAGGSSAAPKTANGQSATIGVANESLGNVLVDARGRTLYLFQRDSGKEHVQRRLRNRLSAPAGDRQADSR
jgi:predicted lipoprotein with Yx(FWY)xxD motif